MIIAILIELDNNHMEKDFKVHIFCLTSILCDLIMKTISHHRYVFSCTHISENSNLNPDKSVLENLNISPDCIILDKDINSIIKEEIIKKYNKSEFICLPSLNENENGISPGIQQISEPLKMSELGNVLNEIYLNKHS